MNLKYIVHVVLNYWFAHNIHSILNMFFNKSVDFKNMLKHFKFQIFPFFFEAIFVANQYVVIMYVLFFFRRFAVICTHSFFFQLNQK